MIVEAGQTDPAGSGDLGSARQVLEKMRALTTRAANYAAGEESTLTIGFDSIFSRDVLVDSLVAMRAAYLTVAVRLISLAPLDPIQLVAAGEADLGIGLSQGAARHAVELEKLGLVRLLPVVAPSHPLARLRKGFADTELRNHIEIRVTDASRIKSADRSQAGLLNAWRVIDLEGCRALTLAGVGWGVMPEHAIPDDLKKGRLVALVPKSRNPDVRVPCRCS